MKLIAPCTHGVEVGHRRGLRHRKHQMSRRGQAHKRAVHSSSCLGLGPGKQQRLTSPKNHSVGDPCCECVAATHNTQSRRERARGKTHCSCRDARSTSLLRATHKQELTNMEKYTTCLYSTRTTFWACIPRTRHRRPAQLAARRAPPPQFMAEYALQPTVCVDIDYGRLPPTPAAGLFARRGAAAPQAAAPLFPDR